MANNNLTWNDVQSQVGNPASYGALANQSFSTAGTILSKISDQIQKERDMDLQNQWKQMELAYNQQKLAADIEQHQLANALARETLNETRRGHTLSYLAQVETAKRNGLSTMLSLMKANQEQIDKTGKSLFPNISLGSLADTSMTDTAIPEIDSMGNVVQQQAIAPITNTPVSNNSNTSTISSIPKDIDPNSNFGKKYEEFRKQNYTDEVARDLALMPDLNNIEAAADHQMYKTQLEELNNKSELTPEELGIKKNLEKKVDETKGAYDLYTGNGGLLSIRKQFVDIQKKLRTKYGQERFKDLMSNINKVLEPLEKLATESAKKEQEDQRYMNITGINKLAEKAFGTGEGMLDISGMSKRDLEHFSIAVVDYARYNKYNNDEMARIISSVKDYLDEMMPIQAKEQRGNNIFTQWLSTAGSFTNHLRDVFYPFGFQKWVRDIPSSSFAGYYTPVTIEGFYELLKDADTYRTLSQEQKDALIKDSSKTIKGLHYKKAY